MTRLAGRGEREMVNGPRSQQTRQHRASFEMRPIAAPCCHHHPPRLDHPRHGSADGAIVGLRIVRWGNRCGMALHGQSVRFPPRKGIQHQQTAVPPVARVGDTASNRWIGPLLIGRGRIQTNERAGARSGIPYQLPGITVRATRRETTTDGRAHSESSERGACSLAPPVGNSSPRSTPLAMRGRIIRPCIRRREGCAVRPWSAPCGFTRFRCR